MSTNLVSAVSQMLTPELLGRLASGFGVDRAGAEKAASASVPGLMGALIALVAKQGGAAKLGNAVAQEQPGLFNNLGKIIGGPGQNALIEGGLNSLSSLLGPSVVSALANAVNKYASVGETGANGLLGVIGPLILGLLGREQRASGLDASGLAQLVTSQKDNVARALPAGFTRFLSGTGVLDAVTSTSKAMSAPSHSSSQPSTPQSSWLMPVLGVLALGALAWFLFGPAHKETVATLPPGAQTPAVTFIVTENDAKNWIGKPVYSRDNKKIGEIVELERGPDNKVTNVYVDTGAFLGLGSNRYRVTSEQIEQVKPDGLILTLTEDRVRSAAPATEATKQPGQATEAPKP